MAMLPFSRRGNSSERPGPSGADNDDRADCGARDDAELLGRAAAGDAAAFGEIVERHAPALYRVAHRMLGQRVEAEDVVQECFARLWTRAPAWTERGGGLVAWLHRVAINQCRDRLRRRPHELIEAFADLADHAPQPDEVLGVALTAGLVDTALGSLPERYRAALVLSYYEGFPNAVVAEIMDLNLKAFESLLLRSRRHMRKVLEKQGLSLTDFEVQA